MRAEFDHKLFSSLRTACKDAEEKVNIKYHKKLKENSGMWSMFLFTAGLCVCGYSPALITIGSALMRPYELLVVDRFWDARREWHLNSPW